MKFPERPLPVKRPATHYLTLTVPLYLPESELADAGLKFDATRDALNLLLSISRLAWAEYSCGNPEAAFTEAPPL